MTAGGVERGTDQLATLALLGAHGSLRIAHADRARQAAGRD